jgi:hypothetical protein
MKALVLLTALLVGVAFVAAPAEAASKKRKSVSSHHATVQKPDPYEVRAYDGDLLGRDPDPFIRLMLIKEGKPRDQSGI